MPLSKEEFKELVESVKMEINLDIEKKIKSLLADCLEGLHADLEPVLEKKEVDHA